MTATGAETGRLRGRSAFSAAPGSERLAGGGGGGAVGGAGGALRAALGRDGVAAPRRPRRADGDGAVLVRAVPGAAVLREQLPGLRVHVAVLVRGGQRERHPVGAQHL